jgi:membrane protein required for colicin V production
VNAVDIAVVVVLLASGVFALMRGFVYEVLAIAGWVAAVLAAFWGLPLARPLARQYISNATVADLAAGAVIFLVVLLASSMTTHAIARRVQRSAISSVDRSLGFAFGLVRGLVLASLGFLLATYLASPGEPEVLATAKTRPLLAFGARSLQALVPPSVVGVAEDKAKEADEAAKQALQAKEMYDRLQSPKPRPAEPQQNTDKSPSYDNQGLERLIQTTK